MRNIKKFQFDPQIDYLALNHKDPIWDAVMAGQKQKPKKLVSC